MEICIARSRSWFAVVVSGPLILPSVGSPADQPQLSPEQARQARLRLLCATVYGSDLSEPLGAIMFKRCLQDPEAMLRPRRPGNLPPLVNSNPTPLVHQSEPAPPRGSDQSSPLRGSPAASSATQYKLQPLAAGVNKGNVDSIEGMRRYHFWAGPGHIEIRMAFREMGVLGAPHRQGLTFDFLDTNGRLHSHNVVVSEAGLERATTSGDLATRQEFIVEVKPQTGLVRMGGYYEIEATGAVTFDPSAPSTANVVPRDTGLVRQSQAPLVTSQGRSRP